MLLTKVFKGELVAQLGTDGDAKELLEVEVDVKKVNKKNAK